MQPPNRRFSETLITLFPTIEMAGWSVSWRPVAESEEMKRAVAEQLSFDDATFATYTSGDVQVSIYAAYWTPGKMSHRLVAGHTPDVCWVGGGWNCVSRGIAALNQPNDAKTSVPAEHRIFELGGRTEHVVFAHFVGSRIVSYGTGREPPWYAIVTDLWQRGLAQKEEQLFVRISSNRPYSEFRDFAPVRMFVERLHASYLASVTIP